MRFICSSWISRRAREFLGLFSGAVLALGPVHRPSVAYTLSIYWIFRGKVKLDQMTY